MADSGNNLGHLQDGPTASRPSFRLIQVLRAVAAILVVVYHSIQMLNLRVGLALHDWVNGSAGVDLFFVISGFVMTLSSAPLRRSTHAARIFLARRLERVVPMYWLATTAKIVVLLSTPVVAVNALGTSWRVMGSYLFLPVAGGPVLVVGWTLTFEMAFYLLFAMVLAMRAPLVPTLGPMLVLLALLTRLPHIALPFAVAWFSKTLLLEFLYGILLAVTLRSLLKIPATFAILLGVAGVAVLLIAASPMDSYWRGITWGVPATAIVIAALALEKRWGERTPRWLLELGDASYSIYLVHGLVLPIFGTLLARYKYHGRSTLPFVIFLLTALSVASGELVYRTVERPMTQWFKGRRRTAIPANI